MVRAIINISMRKCCSQSRCGKTTCTVCARRYAGRITKRIVSRATGKLHVVRIEPPIFSRADFWRWRTEVRNMIDHYRRNSRWWRSFGLQVWLCRDGKLRGITCLGSLTEGEVLTAFNRRWPTALRSIDPSDLRREIVTIVHPNMIASVQVKARYQSVKLAIWPQRTRLKTSLLPVPDTIKVRIEPMPVLL